MAPAFGDGDTAVVSTRAFRRRDPRRFEVVLIRNPATGGREDLKRIVGLPGEEVELRRGVLTVNGARLPEPHLPSVGGPDQESYRWRPSRGEYVVLGDNRGASTDSRTYGAVRRRWIVGPVVRRF